MDATWTSDDPVAGGKLLETMDKKERLQIGLAVLAM